MANSVLGESRSVLSTDIKFSDVEDVLVKYATRIAAQAEQNLRSNKLGKDSNASGRLAESITVTPVEFLGGNYSIEIRMLDYWKWVNDGRKAGKRPPISAIKKWIIEKQLRLDDGGFTKRGYKRDGTLISKSKKKVKLGGKKVSILDATAYKIAAKIGRRGTMGTDFLTDAVSDNRDDLIKEMREAFKKDIVIVLKELESK